MGKRSRHWQPLSTEARALIQSDPGKWDYVELWDGAAAQANAFGATRRAPPLLVMLDDEPEKPDPAQMSFDL